MCCWPKAWPTGIICQTHRFLPEVEAHLASRTPAWAAEITGLSVEQIVQFARLYGGARAAFCVWVMGFPASAMARRPCTPVSCLPAVTGAWQWPGGGALYSNGGLYGLNTHALYGLDAVTPDTRVLDMGRLGAVLAGERRDLGDGPPVSVLLVQNTNRQWWRRTAWRCGAACCVTTCLSACTNSS